MPSYAAFLRGINVGGNKKVAMADLRACLEQAGCSDVRTLLQSGNAVFQSSELDVARLEAALQDACRTHLGLETRLFVRMLDQLKSVVANNPFPDEATTDPSHLLVIFLDAPADTDEVKSVNDLITGPEKLAAYGSQLYAIYPEGIGTSTVDRTPGWKKLVGSGTARNWNTVNKVLTAFD